MRLRQLEYFCAVAEAGSITRAAADLFVAQPSLSQQLGALERELGGKLFERTARGVELTAAGRAFWPEARTALAAADRAGTVVRAVAAGRIGELRVATITSLAIGLMPGVIGAWRAAHPHVALRLSEHLHPDLLEDQVRLGAGDLGVGPIPRGPMAEVVELGAEEFVVVLPHGDEAAGRAAVDPADLAEREWVLFDAGHGLSDLVRRACSLWGFVPRAAVRTSQVEAAVRLASCGLGPALVPANVIDPAAGVVARPTTRRLLRFLGAYARRPMTPLERGFVDVALGDATVAGLRRAAEPDPRAIAL